MYNSFNIYNQIMSLAVYLVSEDNIFPHSQN